MDLGLYIEKTNVGIARIARQCLEEAKDNLDSLYQQEMEQYVKEKTGIIEKLHVERRSAWKTMHEVTNRQNTPLSKIKGFSKTERIQSWYNHFKNLFDAPDLSSIWSPSN